MKKTVWLMGFALLGMVVLGACSEKKASKTVEFDDEELIDNDAEADDDEDVADFDEELADGDDPGDYEDEERPMTPEEREAYENEVWTALGGTYMFSDGETMAVLDVVIEDDTRAKLTIGDEEFYATIDENTGLILAFDDENHQIFDGFVYAGGNLLKGELRGKPVRYDGMGGL